MKDEIVTLLQNANTEKALELLVVLVPEATTLLTQFNEAKKREHAGSLPFEKFSQIQKEVTYSAIEMLKNLVGVPTNQPREIVEFLLKMDFRSQKNHIINNKIKNNIILLQGSPNCGLKYFILSKHGNNIFYSLKADQINLTDDETEFWEQFARWVNLSDETKKNIRDPRLSPSTLIFSDLNNRLKEKPIVLIIYEVELWKDNCLNNLIFFANKLSKIPLFEGINGAFCYFIHTDIHTDDSRYCDGDNLIALPLISELDEGELEILYLNYVNHFKGSKEDVKDLFSGHKKLVDIIDTFIVQSNYGVEIDRYLNTKSLF